ncbi:MAG: tetratricopeptide repeat protein [Gemmatimonadetes bacterium]|nr:tetratricopeptide repeat protein [Gemmatimonadota bacterium]
MQRLPARAPRAAAVAGAVLIACLPSCQGGGRGQPDPPAVPDIPLDAEVAAAVERARTEVEADREDPAAWMRLGMTFAANELPQQAAATYETAAQLAAEDPKAWYHLGLARARTGALSSAIEALGRAGELDSAYAPTAWRRGFWRLETGDLAGAGQDFRRARGLDPEDVAGTTGLARLALQRGEAGTAAALLESLTARQPREPYYHQLLGRAYLALGRDQDAEAAFRRGQGGSMPRFEDPWEREMEQYAAGFAGRRDRALAAFAGGRLPDAIEKLRALLEERPGDGSLSYALAVACMSSGQPREAVRVLEAAAALNPGHNLLQVALSDAYRQSGDLDRALAHADRAVGLNPSFMTHFRRAGVLEALGRTREALDAGALALSRDRKNLGGLQWLAGVRMKAGELDAAAETWARLAELEPAQPGYWLGLGRARLGLGDLEEAREALREAERLAPRGWKPARLLRAELEKAETGAKSGD